MVASPAKRRPSASAHLFNWSACWVAPCDQFSFRGHLEEQVGVLGAELGELFIGHRLRSEDRGQK